MYSFLNMVNCKVPPIKSFRYYFFVIILALCLAGKCVSSDKDGDELPLEEFDEEHLDKPCAKNELSFIFRELPYNLDEKTFDLLIKNLTDKRQMDAYDLREDKKYTECTSLKEISNQGGCDSCWAVASTDVMTDRLCIQSSKSNRTNTTRYSALDLLACCSYCRNRIVDINKKEKGVCDAGGKHQLAWKYWVEKGIVSGYYHNDNSTGQLLKTGSSNYELAACSYTHEKRNMTKCSVKSMYCPKPTEKEQPSCEEKSEWVKMKGKVCYFLNRQFDGKEYAMKLEIWLNGPVHTFMTPYKSFYEMFSDKTKDPKDVEPYLGPKGDDDASCGAHSVRIVGWGKNMTDGRSYWIAANSWGEQWGNNGFFHLDFNHDNRDYSENRYESKVKGDKRVFAGIPVLN